MEETGIFETDAMSDKCRPNNFTLEIPHLSESYGLNRLNPTPILLTENMYRKQMFTELSELQRSRAAFEKANSTTEDKSKNSMSEHNLKFVKTEDGSLQCLRCNCVLIAGANCEDHLLMCESLNSCDNSSSDFDIDMLHDSDDSSTEEENEIWKESEAVCRIFQCSLCNEIFQCKAAYLDHKNCCDRSVLVNGLAGSDTEMTPVITDNVSTGLLLLCNVCGTGFHSAEELVKHSVTCKTNNKEAHKNLHSPHQTSDRNSHGNFSGYYILHKHEDGTVKRRESKLTVQRPGYGDVQDKYRCVSELLTNHGARKKTGKCRERDIDSEETSNNELTSWDMNKEAERDKQKTKKQKQKATSDINQDVVNRDRKKDGSSIESASETDPDRIHVVNVENNEEVTIVLRNGTEVEKEVIVIRESSDNETDTDNNHHTHVVESSKHDATQNDFEMKIYKESKIHHVSKGQSNDGSYRCAKCEETFLTYVMLKIHHQLKHKNLNTSRRKQKLSSGVTVKKLQAMMKKRGYEVDMHGEDESSEHTNIEKMPQANGCEVNRFATIKQEAIGDETDNAVSTCETLLTYWCFFRDCRQKFETREELKKHIGWEITVHNSHVGEAYEQKLSSKDIQFNLNALGFDETVSSCEYKGCGYLCMTGASLWNHTLAVHSESGFVCDREDCFRRFDTRFKLRSHIIVDHPVIKSTHGVTPNLKRKIKKAETSETPKLKRKIKKVETSEGFVCEREDCLRSFDNKFELRSHIIVDHPVILSKHGVTPKRKIKKAETSEVFDCDREDCVRSFDSKFKLRSHIIVDHPVMLGAQGLTPELKQMAENLQVKHHLKLKET